MTIRRREKEVPTALPAAKLYLDDIEEIVHLLHEAAGPAATDAIFKTSFSVRDKICDEVEELAKITRSATVFNLHTYQVGKYMADLDVDWSGTHLSARGLTREQEWALYHRVEDVFNARKLHWRTLSRTISNSYLGWGWLATLVPLLLLAAFALKRMLPLSLARWISLVAIVLISIAFIFGLLHHTVVIFRHSSEQDELRREAAWKIVPDAVKIIVGFVLGVLTLYLKHKFWP
jgi:hypothetical protein